MDQTIAFAKNVKEELLSKEYTDEEKKCILSGLFLNASKIDLENSPHLSFKTEIASCAQFVYLSLKSLFHLESKITYSKSKVLKKNLSYIVSSSDKHIPDILKELKLYDSSLEKIVQKEYLKLKYFRFLLIGLFLATGSINNPFSKKTSYYLEISFNSEEDAKEILKKLNSFKDEKAMNFKMIKRREKFIIYLKKSDQISVFLSYIGATSCMFEFENARISKDDINIMNRLTICDTSNLQKTMKVAKDDIDTINYLLNYKPLSLFDKKTQAVIKVRLENPDMNFREIASKVSEDSKIVITKSGVVHILTSLRRQAEEYKNKATMVTTKRKNQKYNP